MREPTGVRPAWFVIAVVAALIAAPVGAVAATTIVKIAGPSGKVAQVDPANRLQVAEWSPRAVLDTGFLETDGSLGCRTLFHVPSTKALIVTQLVVVTKAQPSFDQNHGFLLNSEPACGGAAAFVDIPHQVGTEVFTLDPGLPLPAGGTLSGQGFGSGTVSEVSVRGYFVPKSAVP